MPIYDYVCAACGHRWEVIHGLNETGPHQCLLCGGPVSRAFVPPTIHFKGSGWARTDRRTPAGRPKRPSGGDAAADPTPSTPTAPTPGGAGGPSTSDQAGGPSTPAGSGED